MEYHRLPLIDDSSAEFVKMLSVSLLERGVILFGIVIFLGELFWYSELKYMQSKNILL